MKHVLTALVCLFAMSLSAQTGCTDELACNFDVTATNDDGSCDYCFCGVGTQWNESLQTCEINVDVGTAFCGTGTYWDEFVEACMPSSCIGDLDGDGMRGIQDLLMLLTVFDSECQPQEPEWNCGDPVNYQSYN